MSVSGDIAKFNRKVKKNATIIFKKVSFDAYSDIIRMTPVDPGRAKGNWLAQINHYPLDAVEMLDKTGSKGLVEAAQVTERLKLGDSMFIVNNLPYIQKLEDGHSPQGANMVRMAKLKFKRSVNMAARSLR